MTTTQSLSRALLAVAVLIGAALPARAQMPAERPQYPPPPPERQAPAVERNLKTLDVLDFDVFSNQKWDRIRESHVQDILVPWPHGQETRGIEKHIEDPNALLVSAPDTTTKVHP